MKEISITKKFLRIVKLKFQAIFTILIALTILLSGCGTKTQEIKQPKVVKTMDLKKASIAISVDYPSKLVPKDEINISSKIPGRVNNINFDVGDEVKKGDVLFTIDAKDIESQLHQSQAALSGTKENVKQQLLEARSNINQIQIQYDDAKRLYEKTKSLYNDAAVSKQSLDDAEAKYNSLSVQLSSAKDALAILQGKDSQGLALAQTNQAQSAVDAASAQVENSVIKSPIDGKVSIRNVEVGELTSSSVIAFTIINTDSMFAEISVPDTVQSKLSKNQVLKVKISQTDEKTVDGIIDTISPAADGRTRFYTVKIKIDNKDNLLKAGMFSEAEVPLENKSNVFTVPNGAIVSESGIEYIYIVKDGIIVRKTVTTGLSTDKETEIAGSIQESDKVVLEGQNFLNEGENVKIQ